MRIALATLIAALPLAAAAQTLGDIDAPVEPIRATEPPPKRFEPVPTGLPEPLTTGETVSRISETESLITHDDGTVTWQVHLD